jgi:hypothetical protein
MKKTNLNWRVSREVGSAMFLLAAVPGSQAAQSIIMTPPPPPTTPAWSQEEGTNDTMEVFVPTGQLRQHGDETFQLGPVTFRPHVNYNFVYGDSIEYSTNHTTSSIIQTIAPGMSVDLGKHWTADYTPTLTYYSSSQLSDSLNHQASLNGATAYEDWLLGLTQTWNLSSAPLAQTAAQTETEDFNTGATASYIINNHFSTDLGVNQDFNYVTGIQDSKTWSTMDWLNYSFWKRLAIGIGAGAGYTSLSPDGNSGSSPGIQTFEQLQGRVNWRATDKFSFSVSAGFEDRAFHTTGLSDSFSPIFSASIQYLPFEHTQLSLSASRTVSSSDYYILSQSTEVTSVGASLDQRLLEKFYLDVTAGYSESQYTESIVIATANRVDTQYNFNVSLRHPFLKRGSVAVSYQYEDNESTAAGFSYTTSQVGFSVSYSY